MCGIATISIGKSSRGRIPYTKLRGLTREMLVRLSARGKDASGIAVINDTDCFVFKKPLQPARLVVRPRFEEILSKIGPKTNFILLHSRNASVGGNEKNFNNHPIVVDPIIGIHNGTLYNESHLFRKYKNEFKAEGDVDSEVIFKLWHMYLERGLDPRKALRKVSEELCGAFTGAAVDLRNTHRMLMFRYQRELTVLTLQHFDMIVAISEIQFYDQAKKAMGLTVKDRVFNPKEETGFMIDVNVGRITDKLDSFTLPVQEREAYGGQSWGPWMSFL